MILHELGRKKYMDLIRFMKDEQRYDDEITVAGMPSTVIDNNDIFIKSLHPARPVVQLTYHYCNNTAYKYYSNNQVLITNKVLLGHYWIDEAITHRYLRKCLDGYLNIFYGYECIIVEFWKFINNRYIQIESFNTVMFTQVDTSKIMTISLQELEKIESIIVLNRIAT